MIADLLTGINWPIAGNGRCTIFANHLQNYLSQFIRLQKTKTTELFATYFLKYFLIFASVVALPYITQNGVFSARKCEQI